jgi:transcriptional antiterminator RfaH
MIAPEAPPACFDDVSAWHLLKLKPSGHDRAITNLVRQGFVVFAPRERATTRRRDVMVDILRPLFPGYVFAGLTPAAASWRPLNGTYGVSNVVSFDGQSPASVPHDLINDLRSRCDAGGTLIPLEVYEVGEAVQVVRGPFVDWIGQILAAPSEGRAYVLLDLMGRSVRARLPLSALRRAV